MLSPAEDNSSRNGKKMSVLGGRQRPLRLSDGGKRGVLTQFGALCWRRRGGEIQVLLVTSRRRRRWIIPKGWPQDRATPAKAAAAEAWEEAGVQGEAKATCLGIFSYDKVVTSRQVAPCVVAIFPMRVKKLRRDFPEASQRKRKWFSLADAAKLVSEPELAAIIGRFDPAAV